MTDDGTLTVSAPLPPLRRAHSYAAEDADKLSSGLAGHANSTDHRERVRGENTLETLRQAVGPVEKPRHSMTKMRTFSGTCGASGRTYSHSPGADDPERPSSDSAHDDVKLSGGGAVTDRSLRRLSAGYEEDITATPRPATNRIRRQRRAAYNTPLADIQIMRMRSRAGSQVPSAVVTPREAAPSTLSPAVAQRIAAGVSQAQAAMERRMASRRQSRQASRMSRRLSPRSSYAARGSPEAVQKNLIQAREALRRFEEAAAASRPIELPSSASPARAPSQTMIRHQSQSEWQAAQGSAEQRQQTSVAVVPSTRSREAGLPAENAKPHVSSPTREEERRPSGTRDISVTAGAVPDKGRREPPVASSRRDSQGEKPTRLDALHAELVQSDLMQLAQLDHQRRASRIASRMASRPISRNPALLSSSAVSNRADVAKAAAEELRRRVAAEQQKVDSAAGAAESGASEKERRSSTRRDKRSPASIEMMSADYEDHVSSSDHAPRSTSSQEEPTSYPPLKSRSNHSDWLVSRLFSKFFSVSSTASEASSSRSSRRRSFVPIVSPTPRSPCHAVPESSESSHRRSQQQNPCPPTQEASTNGRGSASRAHRRRPLQLEKFHEQLPRKALGAVYENSQNLLRQCPHTDGASDTSGAGTSSLTAHSGRPPGLSSVRQRRDRTFWESLPWRRRHQSGENSSFEWSSDSRDSETIKPPASRRPTEGNVSNVEDAFSSRTHSFYSSSGSLSPRFYPNEKARRSPVAVPILDFSWLEKIATKRESRGLPPQPYMSRLLLVKKRASSDEPAKLSARLKKQQVSILRESSLLATRRSVRASRRMRFRRATIDTIVERDRYNCLGARGRSPHSTATATILRRAAPSSLTNNQHGSLDSLKGVKRAGRDRRRFYSKTATPRRSPTPSRFIAKKTRCQNMTSSSSLSFEASENLLREGNDQIWVTPKSPLSWLSQVERNSRTPNTYLGTASSGENAVFEHPKKTIPAPHRVGRRPRRASCQRVAQASISKPTCHHMSDKKRDLHGRDTCSLPRSESPAQPDGGGDSAKASFSSVDVYSPSDHQQVLEDSTAFDRQGIPRKMVYSPSKKGSDNFSTGTGCDGLLIAVEPVLEQWCRSKGRRDGRRVWTGAIDERSLSSSPRARTPPGEREPSSHKPVGVGSEERDRPLHNVVDWGVEGDQSAIATTFKCRSERQSTHLCHLHSGEREIQRSGSSPQRSAEEDKSSLRDIRQKTRLHELRGLLNTAVALKQRRESSAEGDDAAGGGDEKQQGSRQAPVNRQLTQEEQWEQGRIRQERGTSSSPDRTGFKVSSTRIFALQKEAPVSVARSLRARAASTKNQVSTAQEHGGNLGDISGSEEALDVSKGLHQGAETDGQPLESAEELVEGGVSNYHDEVAHTRCTGPSVVIQDVQSEYDMDLGQLGFEDDVRHNHFSISGVPGETSSSLPSYATSRVSFAEALEQGGEYFHIAVDLASSMASKTSQQADVNNETKVTSFMRTATLQGVSDIDGVYVRECGSIIERNDIGPTVAQQPLRTLTNTENDINAEHGGLQRPTSIMANRVTDVKNNETKCAQGIAGTALFSTRGGATRGEERSQDCQVSPKKKERIVGSESSRPRKRFSVVHSRGGDERKSNALKRRSAPERVSAAEGREPPAERAVENGRLTLAKREVLRQQNGNSSGREGSLQNQVEMSARVEEDEVITAERSRNITLVRRTPTPLFSIPLQEVEEKGIMSFVGGRTITREAEVGNVTLITDKRKKFFPAPNCIRNKDDVTTAVGVNGASEVHLAFKDVGTESATEVSEGRVDERRDADERPQKKGQRRKGETKIYGTIDPAVVTVEGGWVSHSNKDQDEKMTYTMTDTEGALRTYESHKPVPEEERKKALKLLTEQRGMRTMGAKEESYSSRSIVHKKSASSGCFSDSEMLNWTQADEHHKLIGIQEASDKMDTPEAELPTVTLERQEVLPIVPEQRESLPDQRHLANSTVDASSENTVAPEAAATDRDRGPSISLSEAEKTAHSRGTGGRLLEKDATQSVLRRENMRHLLEQTVEAALSHEGGSPSARSASEVVEKHNSMSSLDKEDLPKSSDEIKSDAPQRGMEHDKVPREPKNVVVEEENARDAAHETRPLEAADELRTKSLQEARTGQNISPEVPVIERSASERVMLREGSSKQSFHVQEGEKVVLETARVSYLLQKSTSQKMVEEGVSTVITQHDVPERHIAEKRIRDSITERKAADSFPDNHLAFSSTIGDDPRTDTFEKKIAEGCEQKEPAQLPQYAKRSMAEQQRKAAVHDQTDFIDRPVQAELKVHSRIPVPKEVNEQSAPASGNTQSHDPREMVPSGSNFREACCRDVAAGVAQGLPEEEVTGKSPREASAERGTEGVLIRGRRKRKESTVGIEIDEAVDRAPTGALKDGTFQPMQQKRFRKCPEEGNYGRIRRKDIFAGVGEKEGRRTQVQRSIMRTERRRVTAEKGSRRQRKRSARSDDEDRNQRNIGEPPPTELKESVISALTGDEDSLEDTTGFLLELAVGESCRRCADGMHQGEVETNDLVAVCSEDVRETTEGWERDVIAAPPFKRWSSTSGNAGRKARKTPSEDQATPAALEDLSIRDGAESGVSTAGGSLDASRNFAVIEDKEDHSMHPASTSQVQLAHHHYADAEPDSRQRPTAQSSTRRDQERPHREAPEEQQRKRWGDGTVNHPQAVKSPGRMAVAVSSFTTDLKRTAGSSSAIPSGASVPSLDVNSDCTDKGTQRKVSPYGERGENDAALVRETDEGVAAKDSGPIKTKRREIFKGELETSRRSGETPPLTASEEAAAVVFSLSEGDIAESGGATVKLCAEGPSGEVSNPVHDEILPPGADGERAIYTAVAVDDELSSPISRPSIDSKEVWVADGNLDKNFDGACISFDGAPSATVLTGTKEESNETVIEVLDGCQLRWEDAEEKAGKVVATGAESQTARECARDVVPLSFTGLGDEVERENRSAHAPLNTSDPAAGDLSSEPPLSPVVGGLKGKQAKNVAGTEQEQLCAEPQDGANSAVGAATETAVRGVELLYEVSRERIPDSTSISVVEGDTYGDPHGVTRLSEREWTTTASQKTEDGATAESISCSYECVRQQRRLRQSPKYPRRSSKLAALLETTAETARRGQEKEEHAASVRKLTSAGENMAGDPVDAFPHRASVSQSTSLPSAPVPTREGIVSRPGELSTGQHDDLTTSAAHSRRKAFEDHSAMPAEQRSGKGENRVGDGSAPMPPAAPPVDKPQGEAAAQPEPLKESARCTDSEIIPDSVLGRLGVSSGQARRNAGPDKGHHMLLDSVPEQRRSSEDADGVKRAVQLCKLDEPKPKTAAASSVREHRTAADVPAPSGATALKGGAAWAAKEKAAASLSPFRTASSRGIAVEGQYVESLDNSAKMTITGKQEDERAGGVPQHRDVLSPKVSQLADATVTTAQTDIERRLAEEQRPASRAVCTVKGNIRHDSPSKTSSVSSSKSARQRAVGALGIAAGGGDTGEMRPITPKLASAGATECKDETGAGHSVSPNSSGEKKASAPKRFPGAPSVEEGTLEQRHEAPVVELGDELCRWDSTVCPSPPFSPRYIPLACPPPRPVVPPLNLYWLRGHQRGPVHKKRLKDLVKTLQAGHVCQASPPQIAAVSLDVEPPLQSDDDRKKADIVASLLVEDPVGDLDTDVRKHQLVLNTYDGPPLPRIASTRSCILTTQVQTPGQHSLDLEKSPELKAPRGEHPPIYRRWESAGAVLAALEKTIANADDSLGVEVDSLGRRPPRTGSLRDSETCRSRRQICHPFVQRAARRSKRTHTKRQPETSASPLYVEATRAVGRQKVADGGISTGGPDAAEAESSSRACGKTVVTCSREDGSVGRAVHEVSPSLREKNSLPQQGALENEATSVERLVGIPESSRRPVGDQLCTIGGRSSASDTMDMQRETSYREENLSRDGTSLERSKDDSGVRSGSLCVEKPILLPCAKDMPIDMNRHEERAAAREHSPVLFKEIHVREKRLTRTLAQEKLPVVVINKGVRVRPGEDLENAENPRLRPAAEEAPSLGEATAARTPRLRREAAGGPVVKGRSLEDARVAGRKDDESCKQIPGHMHTKPSLAPAQSVNGLGLGQPEARAKTQSAAENVLQLIRSATMLLRANEAMGTWTRTALADAVPSRHGSQGRLVDLAKGATEVQENKAAARLQRRLAYADKLASYEGFERKQALCAYGVHSKRFHVEGMASSLESIQASGGSDKVSADVRRVEGAEVSAPGRPLYAEASAVCAPSRATAIPAPQRGRVEGAELRPHPPARTSQKDSLVAARIQSYERMALRKQSLRRNNVNTQNPAMSLPPAAKATRSALWRELGAWGIAPTRAQSFSQESVPPEAAAASAFEGLKFPKSAKALTEASRTQAGVRATVPALSPEKSTEETAWLPSSFNEEFTGGAHQAVTTEVLLPRVSPKSGAATSSRQEDQRDGAKDGCAYTNDQPQQPSEPGDSEREPFKTRKRCDLNAFSPSKAGPSVPETQANEATPQEVRREKALLPCQMAVNGDAMVQPAVQRLSFRAASSASNRQEGTSSLTDLAGTSLPDQNHQLQLAAVAVEGPPLVQTATALPQLPACSTRDVRRLQSWPRRTCRSTRGTKLQEKKLFSLTEGHGSQDEERLAATEGVEFTATKSRPSPRSPSAMKARISLTERRDKDRAPVTYPATPDGAPQTQMRYSSRVLKEARESQVHQENGVSGEQSALLDASVALPSTSVDGRFAHIGGKDRCASSRPLEKDLKAEHAANVRGRPEHPAREVTHARGSYTRVCGLGKSRVPSKRAAVVSESPASSRLQDRKKLQTDLRTRTERLIASAARLKKAAGYPLSTLKKSAFVHIPDAVEEGRSIRGVRDVEMQELLKQNSDDVTSLLHEATEPPRACRDGAVKTALADSPREAAAHKRYILESVGLGTPVKVCDSRAAALGAGTAIRHTWKRVGLRKAASPTLGAERRASYQLNNSGTPVGRRTEFSDVFDSKIPGDGSRTCLSDSMASKGRNRQERPASVEEAKAVFLQSWWKAVTVRKWLDAARCVRDFETSTSSVPSSSLFGTPLLDGPTEEYIFPHVAPVTQGIFPTLNIREARYAACVTPPNYLAPGSQRKSFADAFFEILAAETREKRVRSSSAACPMSHPKMSGERVESEPACLRISQRHRSADVSQSLTAEYAGKHIYRHDTIECSVSPCRDNLVGEKPKGSSTERLTVEPATCSTKPEEKKEITGDGPLPHRVGWTLHTDERCRLRREGNTSVCRHRVDSCTNRAPLRCLPGNITSPTRGAAIETRRFEGKYRVKKEGSVDHNFPENGKHREARTTQGPRIYKISQEEAPTSQTLSDVQTFSVGGRDNNGAGTAHFPPNEHQSRGDSREEFRRRNKDKEQPADYGEGRKICEHTECSRHEAGTGSVSEEEGFLQLRAEGKTCAQNDRSLLKLIGETSSQVPETGGPDQASCAEENYEGGLKVGGELPDIPHSVRCSNRGPKGNKESTEKLGCEPKGVGADRVEARDLAQVQGHNVTERSLVAQDMEVQAPSTSGARHEQANKFGSLAQWFQKKKEAGSENDADDGGETAGRNHVGADSNHSEMAEAEFCYSKEFNIVRGNCKEHSDRQKFPVKGEVIQQDGCGPAEHDKQDIAYGCVRPGEEHTATCITESEAQEGAPPSVEQKLSRFPEGEQESFLPHAPYETLSSSQDADSQTHQRRDGEDEYMVSSARSLENRAESPRKSSRGRYSPTRSAQRRNSTDHASGCREGRTEVENLSSQPDPPRPTGVSADAPDIQNALSERKVDNSRARDDAHEVGILLSGKHSTSRAEVERENGDVDAQRCTSASPWTNASLRQSRADPHDRVDICNVRVSDDEELFPALDDDDEDPFAQLVGAKKASML